MTSPDTEEEMPAPCVGVDQGATLAKVAVRAPGGSLRFEFLSASNLQTLEERIVELGPGRIGITGCGAGALEDRLGQPAQRCIEFEAWGRGSRTLLQGQDIDTDAPYLLGSLGTGTSILRVEGGEIFQGDDFFSLKDAAGNPFSGAYWNEADYDDAEWQESHWGVHYPRLSRIKAEYDPQGLFVCHRPKES